MEKKKIFKKLILTALMLVTATIALVVPSFALAPVANSTYYPVYQGNVNVIAVMNNNARVGFTVPLTYFHNGSIITSMSTPRDYETEDGSTYTAYSFNRVSIANTRGSYYGVEGAPLGGSGYYGIEIVQPRFIVSSLGAYKMYEGDIAYFWPPSGQPIECQVVVRGVKDTELKTVGYAVSKPSLSSGTYYYTSGRIAVNYLVEDFLGDMLTDFDLINDIQIVPVTRSWSRVGVIQTNSLTTDYVQGQGFSSYISEPFDVVHSFADGISTVLNYELFPDFKLSWLLMLFASGALVFGIFKFLT